MELCEDLGMAMQHCLSTLLTARLALRGPAEELPLGGSQQDP